MKRIAILSAGVILGLGVSTAHADDCASKAQGSEAFAAHHDIVDTAIANGSFETLVAAVQAAGLVETLKGEGPFTVFAPTDEAFAKVPKADLEALLANPEQLEAVLTYHVVPGKVLSTDLEGVVQAQTVQGQSVSIDATDGVTVDGARVVQADVEAKNGVIHVIDTVILPRS